MTIFKIGGCLYSYGQIHEWKLFLVTNAHKLSFAIEDMQIFAVQLGTFKNIDWKTYLL